LRGIEVEVIFQKEISNKFKGPGLVYFVASLWFIIIVAFVYFVEPFPLTNTIYIIGIIILITSIILIFISIIMMITTKPFIIYNDGIQYVTKQILPHRNYKNNFIPYSHIKSIILYEHPVGDFIQIKNYKGWVYEIPLECVCKKIGKEKWICVVPLDSMIKKWSDGKNVNLDKTTTVRGDRSIYTLGKISERKSNEKSKKLPIIWKFLITFGLIVTIGASAMFYLFLHDTEMPIFFNIFIIVFLPMILTLISLTATYFLLKNDRRYEHLFKK
jgi:hypothetical protein